MVRVRKLGGNTILDVYSNDTGYTVAKAVEEIGGNCSDGRLIHILNTTEKKKGLGSELEVDWIAFEACGGKMRFHDSIVLDSPYETIDDAEEYMKMFLVLVAKNGFQ